MSKKEDLIFIADVRGTIYSKKELWNMTVSDIVAKIGDITDTEHNILEEQRKRRKEFEKLTVDEVKKVAKQIGADINSKMTKGGIIDEILTKENTSDFILDDDQQKVLAGSGDMVIDAGPGSGKTTTICYLINKIICSSTNVRVLVLVFNRIAETIINSRLKRLSTPYMIPKTKIGEATHGVVALTFDKLAAQINSKAKQEEYDEFLNFDNYETDKASYSQNMQEALRKCMQQKYMSHWDYIIVDEAQDVREVHAALIHHIMSPDTKLIVAGDPRQEIYQGAGWFSEKCIKANPSTKYYLRYNHRSEPEIVSLLNKYSKACFPTLHVEQLASKKPCTKNIPIISNIIAPKTSTIGEIVGHVMSQFPPTDVYAIAPVTVRKYGLDEVIPSIKDVIFNFSYGSCVSVLDKPGNTIGHKGVYDVGTSMRLKGSEREVVVIYGFDRDYMMIDKIALFKRMYVALSRASTHIILVGTKATGALPEILEPLISKYPTFQHSIIDEIIQGPIVVTRSSRYSAYSGNLDFDGIYRNFSFSFTENRKKVTAITIPIASSELIINDFIHDSIALALGIELPSINNVVIAKGSKQIYVRDGNLISKDKISETVIDIWNGEKDIYPTITYTICRHAIQHGIIVDNSMLIDHADIDVKPIVDLIKAEFDDHMYEFSEAKYLAMCSRSCDYERPAVGVIMPSPGYVGVIVHFIIGGIPIFIVHNNPTDAEREKMVIAIACCNAREGLIINTRYGEVYWISEIPWRRLNIMIRAKLAMNYANVRFVNFFADKTVKDISLQDIVIIDVETCETGEITEIAAIAVNLPTRAVVDVFHVVADGCTEIYAPTGKFFDDFSYLQCTNKLNIIKSQSEIKAQFLSWMKGSFARPQMVHWGGTEARLAGDVPVCDLIKVYKTWLDRNGMGRDSYYSLGVAVEQFIKDIPVCYHRGMEDVICTLGVAVCIASQVSNA